MSMASPAALSSSLGSESRWLFGEPARRVGGRSLGRVLAEDPAELLGLDLWMGLPEEHHHRIGRIAAVEAPRVGGGVPRTRPRPGMAAAYADPGSLTRRAFASLSPSPDEYDPAWWSAELRP